MKNIILSVVSFILLCGYSLKHIVQANRISDEFSCKMAKEGFLLYQTGGPMTNNIHSIN